MELLSAVLAVLAKLRQSQCDSCVLLSCHTTYSMFQWTLRGRHDLDGECFYPYSSTVIWLFSATDAKRWTLIYSEKSALKKVSTEVAQMGNK